MIWSERLAFYENLRHQTELRARTALKGLGEREAFMEGLRCFKQAEEKERLQENEQGTLPLEEMMFALTALAQVCLQESYLHESASLREVHGNPQSHYHMVAMGKFGGCEMTVHSDLDLIFLFAEHAKTDGKKSITNQEYFAKLSQRIISNLSLLTRNGRVYEVDTELRPSGRSGILVSSWASFEEYHLKDARIWEKQALLKARPIEPDPAVYAEVAARLEAQIWSRPFDSDLAAEMHKLRLRMEKELGKEDADYYNIKVGLGGIVDIDFIVQYLQLRYGGANKAIRAPHTLTALRALTVADLLAADLAEFLEAAYLEYRRIETELRLQEDRAVGRLSRQPSEMLECYETYRSQVRQTYLKVLELS